MSCTWESVCWLFSKLTAKLPQIEQNAKNTCKWHLGPVQGWYDPYAAILREYDMKDAERLCFEITLLFVIPCGVC